MAKTDKELTAEIVIAFIESWNAKQNTSALQGEHIPNLIQTTYDALRSLEQ